MEGLNVLSLFDGMSCGQLALQKAGIKVKQYYAAEIDKYAIQVTMANFPDTIQLGDVTKVFAKDLPKIDLIIGGSPCQGFSFAGKGLNFEDPQSKLFFEFVRLINECKPKWFFLENVKMKKEHELVISQYMKVAPIEINSALLSAQNRKRLYWFGQIRERLFYDDIYCYGCRKNRDNGKIQKVGKLLGKAQNKRGSEILGETQKRQSNIKYGEIVCCVRCGQKLDDRPYSSFISFWNERIEEFTGIMSKVQFNEARQNNGRIFDTYKVGIKGPNSLFGETITDIPQPKDKGILLKDILQNDVPDKFYLSDKMLQYFSNKAANFNQGKVNVREEEGKASCLTSSMASCGISDNFIKVDTNLKKTANQDKANCLTAGGNSGGLHSDMTLIGCIKFDRTDEAKQIRKESMKNGVDYTPHAKKEITGLDFDKMNTLTTASNKDNLVMQLNGSTESGGKQPYQQNRVYDTNGLSPALMAQMSCGSHAILDSAKIRRLTPTECERLQTVPDIEHNAIFALCYESAKNYVSVVNQNPKLLKLALDAEQCELNELVKSVCLNMNVSHQSIKNTAPPSADMQIQQQTKQFTKSNLQESNTTASNVANTAMCSVQSQEAGIALQNVFISITEGKITHCGLVELPWNANYSTIQKNGGSPLKMFGKGIMQIAEDVEKNLNTKRNNNFISITSNLLSTKNLEQALIIYYLFAKNVITGFTQNTMQIKNLSLNFSLKHGYTSCASDRQRYRMLGNGWTVDVIAYIFGFINYPPTKDRVGFKPDNECKEQNIADFTGLFIEPASKEITLEAL